MLKFIVAVLAGIIIGSECCSDKSGATSCQSWRDNYNFCSRSDSGYYCAKTCGKCSGGSSNNGQCGVSKVQQGRVVNGVTAKQGAWPWIASLQAGTFHFCGGTLITENWVMTASHCIERRINNPRSVTVSLGDHNRYDRSNPHRQRIGVKRIIMHEKYKSHGMGYDIALLELQKPARLNEHVVLGCLPQRGYYPSVNKQCYIAGWGTTSHPGNSPSTLQQARLPVVERGHRGCHGNRDMVCVGKGFDTEPNGKQHPNACRGDSGGPLMCQQSNGRWQVEGVASYVYTYCKYYTAYTPVNKHVSWINQYIQ